MAATIPPRLSDGAGVRIVAVSRSLAALEEWSGFGASDVEFAVARLESMGLRVSFGAHVRETSESGLASIESRLADLHDAFRDDSVRAVLALSGGIGAIQILEGIDYRLAAAHPKAVIGYSDVGHLHAALLARADLVGYYGPNFTGFAMRKGFERSAAWFRACLFGADPVELVPGDAWSDDDWIADQDHRTFRANDGYWCLQEGSASGTVVGGSVHCLNALQGTPCFPALAGAVLFLESPGQGKASVMVLDAALRSLAMLPDFRGVAGLVLGRFPTTARVTRDRLQRAIVGIAALRGMPVLANADFGHTTPAATLPIGGLCRLHAAPEGSRVTLLSH